MSQGTVKFFVGQKGFGFITPDDGSPDIFVHRTGIVGTDRYRMLEKGQIVEFEIAQSTKGPQAMNVRPMP